jgi:hypothetical protein
MLWCGVCEARVRGTTGGYKTWEGNSWPLKSWNTLGTLEWKKVIFALTKCAQCVCEARLVTSVILRKHLIEKQLCSQMKQYHHGHG